MEKYIGYNKDSSKAFSELNLLCDPRKMKKKELKEYLKKNSNGNSEIKFIDKTYLESFKKFMKNRIDLFTPTKKTDNFDILLISLWHQFIFNTIDEDKYYDFVKLLNKDFV